MQKAVATSADENKGTETAVIVPADERKALEEYEFVFDFVTSLGTVVVAGLAVFGDRLRNWLSRPKIKLCLEDSSPYVGDVEAISATTSSDAAAVSQRVIRLRVINEGRLPARGFSIQVDCVYRQKDGGDDFYKDSLVPRPIPLKEVPLEEARIRMDLIPNFPLFVEIVEIRTAEVLAQDNAATVSAQPRPELFIRIPHGARGEFYCAGQRKVIFPVIFYSESLRKAERQYVEIFWTGQDVSRLSNTNFSVRLIDESRAAAVVGRL